MNIAYAPPRSIPAKVTRRLTQWRAAWPAQVSLERPVLSVCFDDFPETAARDGARALEAHGARGTFYAATGMMSTEGPCGPSFAADDLLHLASRGHEIGCHSFGHADAAQVPANDALADFTRNADAIAALGHKTPLRTLAYPYGETQLAVKRALPLRFVAARGVMPGLNAGRVDRAQLRAFPFFGDDADARLDAALRACAQRAAWMIVFTHDVADAHSPWGTTAGALDRFLTRAAHLGVAIMPTVEASAYAFSGARAWAA